MFFQDEEIKASWKFQRANSLNANVNRPPRRHHLDIIKEDRLNTLRGLLKENAITLTKYVEKILEFYDFYRENIKRMEEDEEVSDEEEEDED